MKKLLLCTAGAFTGPPIAFAAFAETGAGLPGFKHPTFAPADTGMTLGGVKFVEKMTNAPADMGATQGGLIMDPMRGVAKEPEGLGRGATVPSEAATVTDGLSIDALPVAPPLVVDAGLDVSTKGADA